MAVDILIYLGLLMISGGRVGAESDKKMPVIMYFYPASPPCRAAMLVARAVGVDLNSNHTDITSGAQLTPEFIKLNPQHTVPTIDDNGFILSESRAIMGYFVNQYAKDDSLYPKDPKKRAMVDQKLYFDIGTLYQRFLNYFMPIAWKGMKPDDEALKKLEEAVGFLNSYLEGQSWVAGEDITIADYAIAVTMSNIELNPQHTIPTLVDDGIVLTESRAILGYLVDKYAKDDSLYPKDTTKRALVNQKLYFDMELFGRFLIYFKPILFSGDPPDSADLEKIKESLGFLDKFLVGLSWSAGEDITIADYALVATVSNVQEFCLDLSHYPYVDVWFAKAKAVIRGYEEINVAGLSALKEKYEMRTE